ncbi:ABC transporter ATP-binding protein [Falsirhodobacter xinxiangensis]|uniref:ABC transporter ATP-binding protein n=1 Tax=Falsirhodobacter xinxiangensis TaxID=2530049 RepID=UPI0010A9D48E|nr:ABC transporter ATP-binding protein [Rhodobacter xinxiangensis]
MRLQAKGIDVAYDGRRVIEGLDLTIPDGKVTAIIGPNGCGKSTLLKTLARLIRPTKGQVFLDGQDIHAAHTRDVARKLGLLPQSPLAPEGITVADLIARGRAPWRSILGRWSPADTAARDAALSATGLEALADRPIAALSGGQRQRAWIAMTLAQDTPILLLDEPTTYLDLPHQVDLLRLLGRLNRDSGRTVVSVLHDLGLAARFSDHVIVMSAGKVLAEGPPSEVITTQTLATAFGLEAVVIPDPIANTPLVVPV